MRTLYVAALSALAAMSASAQTPTRVKVEPAENLAIGEKTRAETPKAAPRETRAQRSSRNDSSRSRKR